MNETDLIRIVYIIAIIAVSSQAIEYKFRCFLTLDLSLNIRVTIFDASQACSGERDCGLFQFRNFEKSPTIFTFAFRFLYQHHFFINAVFTIYRVSNAFIENRA